jgi:sugar phosphate isomerase/epimerase
MRFGVCGGPEKAAAVAAAGYDYIELAAAAMLNPFEDDAAWTERRRTLDAMPIRPETFNVFITAAKVTGPDADSAVLERYVHTLLGRAALVGGKVVVFGSGGARGVPDGFSRETAREQILRFLGFCADAADKTGVTVAIEPLNLSESNIINTVTEGAEYARTIGRPGVRDLADTYHMEKDGEPLEAIVAAADVLAHVHTADTGRHAPGTGTYDHIALFRTLRAAGYDNRLSIECSWTDFEAQIGPALAHLKAAQAASA